MIERDPRPSDEYTLIRSAALADGTLSFKARGILSYLLSAPAGTSLSPERLAKSGTDGQRAVTSGLKELEDAGYLVRTATDTGDGPPVIRQVITDTPGVGTPTPLPPLPPRNVPRDELRVQGHGWQPSEAAMKTAKDVIEIMDIPLSVTHYRIRAAELKREPSSSEWLRWLVEDEKKARIADREHARTNGQKRNWFAVAGD